MSREPANEVPQGLELLHECRWNLSSESRFWPTARLPPSGSACESNPQTLRMLNAIPEDQLDTMIDRLGDGQEQPWPEGGAARQFWCTAGLPGSGDPSAWMGCDGCSENRSADTNLQLAVFRERPS